MSMKVKKIMQMSQKLGSNKMYTGHLLPNLEMCLGRLNRYNQIIKIVFKLKLKDN